MYVSFELLLMSLLFFFFGLYMYIYDEFIYLEWDLLMASSMDFSYVIYLDFFSIMFMSVILLVSCMICLYSYWYVSIYMVRFYYLMVGFIMSMLILVISPSLLGMLLGWDGLGFVSFCLVLFYYDSEVSLNSALVTLYYNRLGDGFLLVSIGLILFSVGDCSGMVWDWGFVVSLIVLLGLSTKSAQLPFMSWLPKAMSAPTPVSSLVHSSTLVTAGVYIMIRFVDVVEGMFFYMYISLVTMFISGILALVDVDLKKIIAYSTLSQLGLMVFGLCAGLKEFVYFHMLSHAIFKSMMFMSGGIFIHEFGGWQDIRYYGSCVSCFPVSGICLLGGSFSLSGVYFLSGYYSKDILIEMFMVGDINVVMYLLFYFCMILTLLYSFRLLDYLNFGFVSIVYLGAEEGYMGLCMFILYLGSIFYGWFLSFLVFSFEIHDYEMYFIKMYVFFINLFILFYWSSGIWGRFCYYLNMDMHNLFKNVGMVSYVGILDKYWVEWYGGSYVMFNLYNLIYGFKDYSIYLMFMLFFFIYLFI